MSKELFRNSGFLILIFFWGMNICVLNGQVKELALEFFLEEANYEGVIVLYDYQKDEMFLSDRKKAKERVLPASTFKIFNTLLFLELGVVKDTSHTLAWNGTEYKHKGRKIGIWHKDTNLANAFRNSTVWYYVAISSAIEFSTYRDYLKKLYYGKVCSKKRDGLDFWNYGDKIEMSARDQIKFLVKIYENKVFKQAHLDVVKELMIEKETEDYTLRSKTGWTFSPKEENSKSEIKDLGWYIGYVEINKNVYFFAVRLEKPINQSDKNFSRDRKSIARKALLHKFKISIEN